MALSFDHAAFADAMLAELPAVEALALGDATERDITLPCPGCHGGALYSALCAPGETQYRKREGHSRGAAQRRFCGICKGAVPGSLHRDHAPREAVPAHEGW